MSHPTETFTFYLARINGSWRYQEPQRPTVWAPDSEAAHQPCGIHCLDFLDPATRPKVGQGVTLECFGHQIPAVVLDVQILGWHELNPSQIAIVKVVVRDA